MNNYPSFSEIESWIVGEIIEYNTSIRFDIYENFAPSINDIFIRNSKAYKVISNNDSTTDEEREEGLSYSTITMEEINQPKP